MNALRIKASMYPAIGCPPKGIRDLLTNLGRLQIQREAMCS